MQVKEFPIHPQLENLEYALALHFMNYSFCRIHQTLKSAEGYKLELHAGEAPALARGLTPLYRHIREARSGRRILSLLISIS